MTFCFFVSAGLIAALHGRLSGLLEKRRGFHALPCLRFTTLLVARPHNPEPAVGFVNNTNTKHSCSTVVQA